ncbi:MAG: hypothetical protein NE330_07535 [Lentisphaeraceae bacterium]|nr:hypothetical protein [Lentisphaeraceae bacterium]
MRTLRLFYIISLSLLVQLSADQLPYGAQKKEVIFKNDFSQNKLMDKPWFPRFGKWTVDDGLLRGENIEEQGHAPALLLHTTTPKSSLISMDFTLAEKGSEVRFGLFGDGGTYKVIIQSNEIFLFVSAKKPIRWGAVLDRQTLMLTPGQKYHLDLLTTSDKSVLVLDGKPLLYGQHKNIAIKTKRIVFSTNNEQNTLDNFSISNLEFDGSKVPEENFKKESYDLDELSRIRHTERKFDFQKNVILQEKLSEDDFSENSITSKPWSQNHGKWLIENGTLTGVEIPAEKHDANISLNTKLPQNYYYSLDYKITKNGSMSFALLGGGGGKGVRVHVAEQDICIWVKGGTGILDWQTIELPAETWHNLQVLIIGDTLIASVNHGAATLYGKHEKVLVSKSRLSIKTMNPGNHVDNVSIQSASGDLKTIDQGLFKKEPYSLKEYHKIRAKKLEQIANKKKWQAEQKARIEAQKQY